MKVGQIHENEQDWVKTLRGSEVTTFDIPMARTFLKKTFQVWFQSGDIWIFHVPLKPLQQIVGAPRKCLRWYSTIKTSAALSSPKKLPGNCIKNIKAAKREIPFEAILMCGSVICQTFKCSRSPLKSPALYLTWSVNTGLLANCVGPLISI